MKDVEDVEGGLMQAAQRFFVLTNTDNLWKEHLQVSPVLASCSKSCLTCWLRHAILQRLAACLLYSLKAPADASGLKPFTAVAPSNAMPSMYWMLHLRVCIIDAQA